MGTARWTYNECVHDSDKCAERERTADARLLLGQQLHFRMNHGDGSIPSCNGKKTPLYAYVCLHKQLNTAEFVSKYMSTGTVSI